MMKKKVLIIDDDLDVCKEIKYALQNETTDAYYATSASDAFEKLTAMPFCLVIMNDTPAQPQPPLTGGTHNGGSSGRTPEGLNPRGAGTPSAV